MPLRQPSRKDLALELPAAFIGTEMIAPSGIFCMAMPMLMAKAEARETAEAEDAGEADDTEAVAAMSAAPTAMPSGRLWIITASMSLDV